MKRAVVKTSLSPERKSLLELMQKINFGRIEGLNIQNGEPVFKPYPRIVREIKFGSDNGPRPELQFNDFVLKTQVVDFFEQLNCLRDATIETLEIKHGLPFRMNVEESVQV